MPDWEILLKRAKKDVLCAVEAWSSVLEETFGSRLEYAYAKGSALKKWCSLIDYVPIISDVDIHIMLNDDKPLFQPSRRGFATSIEVSKKYEMKFYELRGEYLHIPRSQVIHINPNLDNPSFILPQISEVHVMAGCPKDGTIPSKDRIRKNDSNQIWGLAEYLDDLPRQTFDRVGFDFWTLLRRMCWRVSPSPVRLITQEHPDPLEVWEWNRTTIVEELRKRNLNSIANSYQKYYETGWQLFFSNFSGSIEIRDVVIHGYSVLQGCLEQLSSTRPLPD